MIGWNGTLRAMSFTITMKTAERAGLIPSTSLCHLSLHARHYTSLCDVIYLKPFFRIHHLESVRVHHFDSSNASPWIFEPLSCDISTLAFRYTYIT